MLHDKVEFRINDLEEQRVELELVLRELNDIKDKCQEALKTQLTVTS